MEINKVQDLLNTIAKELFPDLRLEFFSKAFIQDGVIGSPINVASFINIDVREIVQDNVFNMVKAKNILKTRTHEALLQLRNHVQNSLDKLEGK